MRNNISRISKEMERAVKRSGYLLEQEVATILKQKGLFTTPNYAFRDIETDMSKEIDIEALDGNLFRRSDFFEGVWTHFFVEVKNITPLICFTQREINTIYTAGNLQFAGLPENIWVKRNEGILLSDFLKIEKFHHYYSTDRIASQFCVVSEKRSSDKREPSYIASHHLTGNRNLYEELVLPLVKVVISEKDRIEKDWEFDPREEPINLHFYYPIAVVSGLFECYMGGRKPAYKKVHRINFIRRYESKKISGDFRIDICDRRGFGELINDIQKETNRIIEKIKRRKELFRRSALRDAKERYKKSKKESQRIN